MYHSQATRYSFHTTSAIPNTSEIQRVNPGESATGLSAYGLTTSSSNTPLSRTVFMPVVVDTSGRIYDDFSRLLFLHARREASALANELQEESEQFRFLRAACYANIKGSVGLILVESSPIRISIPLDLSSRPFIPLPRFMRSRRAAPLLAPSLVFTPR